MKINLNDVLESNEYHTSGDDLNYVTEKGLNDSLTMYKKCINMFFKDVTRWDVIKMFNKDIPGSNCIREKTIHVSI